VSETSDEPNRELTEAVSKVRRYEAAERAGIPLAHAHRLRGDSAEDLDADAAAFARTLAAGKPDLRRRPQPLGAGGTQGGEGDGVDLVKLAAALLKRRHGD
jgi:hypothetical protein